MQTELPQMGRRVLRRHIWGYAVCLCPIKGTPGLNELNNMFAALIGSQFYIFILSFTEKMNADQ